jgi:hypothetical protein
MVGDRAALAIPGNVPANDVDTSSLIQSRLLEKADESIDSNCHALNRRREVRDREYPVQ